MQKGKEFRYYTLHLICHKHLVAIELYLIALQLKIRLNAWEVEYTGEVERIIYVEVYPEQRFVGHRIECAVEVLIVLILECRRSLCPKWFYTIDDIILVSIYLLAILPLSLLTEGYRHRHKLAILIEQFAYLTFIKEFLAVIRDMQNDISTALGTLSLIEFKLRATIASPMLSLSTILIRASDNLHLVAHHKTGVEAQSEVTDDSVGVVLIFIKEVCDTRESYLIDILIYLLSSHTQTMVADGDGLSILVKRHTHGQVTEFALEITFFSKSLYLLGGINSVGYHLAEENLVITIEKLFDDGEYVFGCYPNITFTHNINMFCICYSIIASRHMRLRYEYNKRCAKQTNYC